ncbi:MAG: AzlD domain-containing protein [Chloroflexota bacterium]|nr:AzlD domain-containing protein [Chloroflexota bacterium]
MTTDLALVVIVAVGTLAMRASMVTLLADVTIPTRVEQALSLVAPAVLAGLVAQTLFLDHGEFRPFGTWYLAAGVAALVAWRTRSFGWTLLAGMVSVWLLEALL